MEEEPPPSETTSRRLKQWILMTLLSSVTFGSIFDVTKLQRSNRIRRWETIVTLVGSFISAILSAIFSVVLFKKWKLMGSVFELASIIFCCVAWLLILPILSISHASYFMTSIGVVTNANIYYSTWGTTIMSVMLLVAFMQQYHDLNVYYIIGKKGSRFSSWILLLCASIVVTGSSISIQVGACQQGDGSFLRRIFGADSVEPFCRRTSTGIGLGTASFLVCLLILCEMVYLGENVGQLLESETLFAILTCAAHAVCIGYITGDGGPAMTIGNLYYSVWISFVTSIHLVLSCLHEKKT